jgi:hypothetical protein
MVETRARTTLTELQGQRTKAIEAVQEARRSLEKLTTERRAAALAAVGGDEASTMRAEELDGQVLVEQRRLRTGQAALEEVDARITQEEQRLERKEAERQARILAGLQRERDEHLSGADKAIGRMSRALKGVVLDVDPRLKEHGAPTATPTDVISELRRVYVYVGRINEALDALLEESRPAPVREMLARLRSERVEAASELENARRTAHQVSGSSPMGRSGEAWHRYYDIERDLERIDYRIRALTESAPEDAERLAVNFVDDDAASEANGGATNSSANSEATDQAYREFMQNQEKEVTA